MKRDLTKLFIHVFYSSPKKNYPTNNLIYNHIDEIWSIDLMDMSDYGISNNKRFRYIFVIIVKFLKYTWCIPLKKNAVKHFSKILTTSKRESVKGQSDQDKEFYNSVFQNLNSIIYIITRDLLIKDLQKQKGSS